MKPELLAHWDVLLAIFLLGITLGVFIGIGVIARMIFGPIIKSYKKDK